MKDLLFIGSLNYPEIPQAGDSVKNQYLMDYFRKYFSAVDYIDTNNSDKKPYKLVQILISVVFKPYRNVVISVSNESAYKIIAFISKLPSKKKFYYFMIGGYTPIKIKQGIYKAEPFKKLEKIVVEADRVCDFYHEVGLDNTLRVYNFKPFSFKPDVSIPHTGVVKFVFLSRLNEMKGVFHIVDCAKQMNQMGYSDKFVVDFYGRIEKEIEQKFMQEIGAVENINYKGFLNLKEETNYTVLSEYDAMLFPTMHPTEGFPGVIADAAIAGVPVIAANWNYAEEIIGDGKCGYLFPVGDKSALLKKMVFAIEHRDALQTMRPRCVAQAQLYNMDNVLNEDLLHKLNMK